MIYCIKCPVCGANLHLLKTSKSKAYCICKDCGMTILIGGRRGNERLQKGQAVTGLEVDESEINPKTLACYKEKIGVVDEREE